MNNWTKKFEDLAIGETFTAGLGDYITLNGTKQRVRAKYPNRNYSVLKGGNLVGGEITVRRNADSFECVSADELKKFILANEKSDKLGKQILEYFKLG